MQVRVDVRLPLKRPFSVIFTTSGQFDHFLFHLAILHAPDGHLCNLNMTIGMVQFV